MNKILEAYKELGLDGIFEYIESLHDRDYEYEDYDEDDTKEERAVEEIKEQVQAVEAASEDIEETYLEKVMEPVMFLW